jgi:hypothetical protein
VPAARGAGLSGPEPDGALHLNEQAQALDMGGAEGAGLAEDLGASSGLMDLQPQSQVASEQAQAHGDTVGMEAGADQMIEIMAVNQLVDHLLDPPAVTIERGQAPRIQPLDAGHVDPGAAIIGRRPGGQRDELQAWIPRAPAQANGAAVLQPAPLLSRESGV